MTISFYVATRSLITAERVARTVTERALEREAVLRGSVLLTCSGALVTEYYDRLLELPGRDGRTMRLPLQDSDQS
ncbi:hypothetical protein AB0E96_00635 [Kitasatospora sp. NPDC036755]|uniref:hypothetical protein n=1 Tax=Kitasatospora sp. NPDC036755 TaxID=3154600 RepID=UPI00340A5CE9